LKGFVNKNRIWLLAVALILCIIPAAYIVAKTVEAQEAETVFFYVTNADGKDILVRAAPIEEIRALSHPMSDDQNYAVSSIDSLPTTCYAEAQGFTIGELIDYLNSHLATSGSEMGELTYQGQDRMYFMADDSFGIWTRNYTAEKLTGVERKYVDGLYEGWKLFFNEGGWLEDFELEHDDAVAYKEQAWSEGEVMPVVLSPLSNSGRTTTNVSETSAGILDYIIANNNQVRGCLRNHLDTDKALTLYIPTSEDQFMKGMRTCSENFKWIYAIKLKMADPPAVQSEGTVPAAVPSYELIESGGETRLKVTLTCNMPEATIYYNDGQGIGSSAQTRYKDPFTIDVTGLDLSTNPIKYYTRTVREGYDDKGPQTMQYYQVAPTFQSVSAGSRLGEDVIFEAQAKVTPEEWSTWTDQIIKITLGYPDGTSRELADHEYQVDNENKTITLTRDLFNTTGSHSLTFEAAGYATRKISRTMKGTAPEITIAAGYPMYKDIVLTFEDSTRAYQANITAKINETNVSATYLDRTEPGKLTIKASYFATGALGEPGEYTLVLSNTNYYPNEQEVTFKITEAPPEKEPACRDGVYLLADADDLFWFARQVNIKGLKDIEGRLTGNINLKNASWTPIGSSSTNYSGIFDGNGYEISGLNVNSEDNYQGLFGYTKDATIKNLTVSGQVNGGGWVGAFAGLAMNSTIENCVNKATVQGTKVNTGGIAGFAGGAGVIQGCSNYGSISGTQSVGGICGQTASTTIIQNCINHGQVHGNKDRVGGITGQNNGGKDGLSVDQCVNTGEVSADENNVGGISGYVYTLISNCYNTGAVLGKKSDSKTGIGGIAGYLNQERISNCYNVGPVSCSADEEAATRIGAVVGFWSTNYRSAGNYYLENDALSGIGFCTFPERAPDETESKTTNEMKALASVLGEPFIEDSYLVNGGFPVLTWQFAIAEANQEAADEVIRLIDAIGEIDAGDACGERIAVAREAFDLLTEEQKSLVTNEAGLIEAEQAYALAVAELAAAKTAAKNKLDTYKDPANYRKAQQAELNAIIAAGKAAIDAATDIDEVINTLENAKATLDKIKTDAELTAAELATAKTAAKNKLDTYKDPANYRKAQQAELNAIIAAGKAAIDAATDIDEVINTLENAKATLDKIKTDAELRDLPKTTGTYTAAIWLVIAGTGLTGLAYLLKRRRMA
jgi:hypothetical protein